ncbi:MAG TPA: SigB/SigF/SigG family RNA polymerase sigma factor [Thermoleophilaceae bacterium]|nr:SigB/SigF/SigG family RNA polymerase sigma factor [Thermoleophilaceae bacterium]
MKAPRCLRRESVMYAPDVHTETEASLFDRWRRRGDEHAHAELVNRHLPLVRQLARRYGYTSEPLDDLVQVGSVGLLHALSRYDPRVGSSFKAYAVPTILGELRRHFRDAAWSVHLPRSLQERTRSVQVAIAALQAALGRSPTIAEIATRIGATPEQVIEAMEARLAYRVESLDAPAEPGDERDHWRNTGEIDNGFDTAEQSAYLSRALNALPERERTLVRLRFEEDLSQSEIGRRLGISQMHVSRLLRRALARMGTIAGD